MKKQIRKKKVLDIPETPPTTVDYNGVDIQFYTKNYDMTKDDKKKLVMLVQRGEFRIFEKYLDWRVNAAAHKMKALLMAGKKDEATSEAAVIEALVKVTQDMQNYWNEVKLMESEEVLLKDRKEELKKPFGKEHYSIDFNEAISL